MSCQNHLLIRGSHEVLDIFENVGFSFSELLPEPEGLLGCASYAWLINFWGCQKSPECVVKRVSASSLEVQFTTPVEPPLEGIKSIYDKYKPTYIKVEWFDGEKEGVWIIYKDSENGEIKISQA